MRKNDNTKMVEKMDHTTPRLIKSSLIQRRSCLDSGVMHRSANLLLIILFWHVFVFVFVSSESYSGTTTSDTRNHFNQKLIFSNNSTSNLHPPSDSEVIHESDSYSARQGKSNVSVGVIIFLSKIKFSTSKAGFIAH